MKKCRKRISLSKQILGLKPCGSFVPPYENEKHFSPPEKSVFHLICSYAGEGEFYREVVSKQKHCLELVGVKLFGAKQGWGLFELITSSCFSLHKRNMPNKSDKFSGLWRWSLTKYLIAAHWYTYEMAEISDFVCASLINKRVSFHWCTYKNVEMTGLVGNHWRIIRIVLIDAHTERPDLVDFVCASLMNK